MQQMRSVEVSPRDADRDGFYEFVTQVTDPTTTINMDLMEPDDYYDIDTVIIRQVTSSSWDGKGYNITTESEPEKIEEKRIRYFDDGSSAVVSDGGT